ncbi:MAG TPA: hypothetical protein VEU30_03675 [Thermoanaerobaculia bacterium]|nr:hypothetical protein [Thermoanaerobaculia bacterium]
MSNFDYKKHLGRPDSCGATYRETNPVTARTADISASGEGCFFSAPTFEAGKIVADTRADVSSGFSATVYIAELQAPVVKLTCTHSATLKIGRLVGVEALEINCDYAARIEFVEAIEATKVTFNVSYSSTIIFNHADIDYLNGLLDYASYGRLRGRVGQPNVDVRHASTWDSQPDNSEPITSMAVWQQTFADAGSQPNAG